MSEQVIPIVSAIVVSHNSREHILGCLQAFYASADVPVEAIVVDNNSSDGSAAAVAAEFPQATVLVEKNDLGYGRAANVGLERCQGRFVLLLSPDVTLAPLSVGRLADFLLTRQDAGAVGPRLVRADGSLDPDARRSFPAPSTLLYRTVGLSRLFPRSPRFGRYNMGHVPETEMHEIDAGSGACLLVRKAALDRVGFFDPRYFNFGEDLDLCYRLKLGGWKIFYLPSASAAHQPGTVSSETLKWEALERHRAMWTYHYKHHSDDVSAFSNGLVWARIWGGYVAERLRGSGARPRRSGG
jgi:GT2 family glycosyltransferase